MLLIYFFILALILLVGTSEQRISKAQFLSSSLFSPFSSSVRIIEDLFATKAENQHLREELAEEMIRNNSIQNELEKIKDAQIDYSVADYDHVLAGIVGYHGMFEERTLVIDKGSLDGIKPGYPVITTSGVIGKIVTVSLNFSIVLPYTNSSFQLGVMSARNHLQGLLISDIHGNSFMTHIKLGSDVAIGDTIVTSNISSIFPANFPVGKVSLIREHSNQINMLAQIEGFTDPASLNHVIVIRYEREKEYETELNN